MRRVRVTCPGHRPVCSTWMGGRTEAHRQGRGNPTKPEAEAELRGSRDWRDVESRPERSRPCWHFGILGSEHGARRLPPRRKWLLKTEEQAGISAPPWWGRKMTSGLNALASDLRGEGPEGYTVGTPAPETDEPPGSQ